MPIRKRGDKYQVRVRIRGEEATKTFTNKRDAKAWEHEQSSLIERGQSVSTKDTLADVIDRYLETQEYDKNRASNLAWWKDELGKKRLVDLRKADFVSARDRLKKLPAKRGGEPIKPATVNRRMAAVSAVLTLCVEEWFLLESNPARLKQITENNGRDRILKDAELEPLLDACEGSEEPALYPTVLMALGSGSRKREITNLRWNDVDLDRGVAILRDTKNDDSRSIPIQGEALEALKRYRKAQGVTPIGSAFVFTYRTGKAPFDFSRAWAKATEEAGITDLRFHDLRHTAGSKLAMAGRTMGEVGAMLGHRAAQTTKRYVHYSTAHTLDMGNDIAIPRKPRK